MAADTKPRAAGPPATLISASDIASAFKGLPTSRKGKSGPAFVNVKDGELSGIWNAIMTQLETNGVEAIFKVLKEKGIYAKSLPTFQKEVNAQKVSRGMTVTTRPR